MVIRKYGETAQLFDKDNADIYTYTTITSTSWAYDNSQPTKCFKLPCKAGETYTISLDTTDTVSTFRVFITDSDDVPESGAPVSGTVVYRGSYDEPLTITTTTETNIVVMYGRSQFDNLLNVTMINEGSMALPYAPFGNTWQNATIYKYSSDTWIETALKQYDDESWS